MSHRNHLMLIEFHLRFNLIFPPVNIIGPSDDFFTSNYTIFIALSVPISGIVEIGLILTRCMLFILYLTSHIGCNLPKCVKSMSKFGMLQLQND